MEDLALMGVPALMLVTLLVQGAKVLGMPARFAPWAALVTGMVVAAAIGAVEAWPEVAPWVKYVLAGLMLWLGAIGAYEVGKRVKRT